MMQEVALSEYSVRREPSPGSPVIPGVQNSPARSPQSHVCGAALLAEVRDDS